MLDSRYEKTIGSLGSLHAGKYIIHALSVWKTSTCRHFGWLPTRQSINNTKGGHKLSKKNNCLVGIPYLVSNLTCHFVECSCLGERSSHSFHLHPQNNPFPVPGLVFTLKRSEEKSHLAPTQMLEATQILSQWNKGNSKHRASILMEEIPNNHTTCIWNPVNTWVFTISTGYCSRISSINSMLSFLFHFAFHEMYLLDFHILNTDPWNKH